MTTIPLSMTTGALTLEAAAQALRSTPIAVLRLISRGRLNGTRLGADGDWLVSGDAVDQYLANGAPDFDPPKFDFMGGDVRRPNWFDTPAWPANQLADALASMAGSQSLSDSDFERQVGRGTSLILVDVQLSAEMRRVLSGPVDAVAPRLPDGAAYKATSAGDYWIGLKLQDAAAAQVSRLEMTAGSRGRLWQLYDSPAQYRSIVGGAINAVGGQSLFSRSEFRNRPKMTSGPGDNLPIQIAYRLRVAQYATVSSLWGVADYLAF